MKGGTRGTQRGAAPGTAGEQRRHHRHCSERQRAFYSRMRPAPQLRLGCQRRPPPVPEQVLVARERRPPRGLRGSAAGTARRPPSVRNRLHRRHSQPKASAARRVGAFHRVRDGARCCNRSARQRSCESPGRAGQPALESAAAAAVTSAAHVLRLLASAIRCPRRPRRLQPHCA